MWVSVIFAGCVIQAEGHSLRVFYVVHALHVFLGKPAVFKKGLFLFSLAQPLLVAFDRRSYKTASKDLSDARESCCQINEHRANEGRDAPKVLRQWRR